MTPNPEKKELRPEVIEDRKRSMEVQKIKDEFLNPLKNIIRMPKKDASYGCGWAEGNGSLFSHHYFGAGFGDTYPLSVEKTGGIKHGIGDEFGNGIGQGEAVGSGTGVANWSTPCSG